MASKQSAWGMEIGASAIKAIRLEREGKQVRVADFAYIPHKKVLTTPDVDQNELVRLSLGQFISQKSLEKEHLVMSVPGHAAFARFAKLPPVEPKKVPDIVKFEAVQQIPFPIEQVEWDYQTFVSDDSPEVEVGIFAITRDRVQQRLGLYAELGLTPEALNLSPVAVYNAMSYDYGLSEHRGPLIFLDIGTSATDVIVVEEGRCWIRTFPLGGTHFTEAIASAFKLSYSKAEKLKREAATSKYAKQIMQAMRPVFSDLLQDLQRSIGYYQASHAQVELTAMVGLGSTFKIPGLRKFLGQQLQLDVVRLDEYKKIQVAGREAASFAENAVNMATAYGLALQGVGLASIDVNLVPVKVLRDQMWHGKTKWFAGAAAIAVVGSLMLLYGPMTAKGQFGSAGSPRVVDEVLSLGQRYKNEYDTLKSKSDVGFTAVNMRRLLDHRTIWPHLMHDSASALAAAEPQDELLGSDVQQMLEIDPAERRFVKLQHLQGTYQAPAEPQGPRRIAVTLNVELSHADPELFLNQTVAQWLRDHAEPSEDGPRSNVPYRIIPETISLNPPQISVLQVEESGAVTVKRGGASSSGAGGAGGAGGSGGAASQPPSGRFGMPTNPSGGMGGGTRGRRMPTGSGHQAPGAAVGVGEGSSQGGTTPPPVGGGSTGGLDGGPSTPDPGGADPGGETAVETPVDEMAPIAGRPRIYPAGTTYYRVPITFTVELLEQKPPAPPDQQAQGDGSRSGAPA